MTIHVPDHDTLVHHIQRCVQKVVNNIGWPQATESCKVYGISVGLIRKIYLWDERDHSSFTLKKLLEAHSWAFDTGIELFGVEDAVQQEQA